jgi:hypothetical protein
VQVDVGGLTLDTAGEWEVVPGWGARPVARVHDLVMRSVAHGTVLNVRSQGAGDNDLTNAGLLNLLREQQWASRPFDEASTVVGQLTIVAGTFKMADDKRLVREFFVTDGRALANAAVVGTSAEIDTLTQSVVRLLATARFAEPARVPPPLRAIERPLVKPFSSSRELYDYLNDLSHRLDARGLPRLGDAVAAPLGHAGMATEFLGESRKALWRLLKEGADQLTPEERADAEAVVQQIDDMFDRRR